MIAHNFNKRGICIYAKPHISITVLDYTYDFQEYIWCSVSLSKGVQISHQQNKYAIPALSGKQSRQS